MNNKPEELITIGPILSLKSYKNMGCSLNWNFHGIKIPKANCSHCFVCTETQNQNIYQDFIKKYFEKLAMSDLYGFVYKSRSRSKQYSINWNQKLPKTEMPDFEHSKFYHQKESLPHIIDFIFKKISNKRGVCVINVLIGDQLSIQNKTCQFILALQNQITIIRNTSQVSGFPIINIMHTESLQEQLNTSSGVNSFYRLNYHNDYFFDFLKRYYSSLSIGQVHLQIQFADKSFYYGPCQSNRWSPQDFSTYKKDIYGPCNTSFTENLIFAMVGPEKIDSLDLIFKIMVKFVDGNQMFCERKLTISGDFNKASQFTVKIKTQNQGYEDTNVWGYSILTDLSDEENVVFLGKQSKSKKRTLFQL